MCYDAVKIIEKRGWHHAELVKYVSGNTYGNRGRYSFPLYSDQSAGNSGAEVLQKSKIRNVCVELDIGEGPWRQSPSFFITGNLIDTFRGLGYDNRRKKKTEMERWKAVWKNLSITAGILAAAETTRRGEKLYSRTIVES